jgi:hypothetical protein
MLAGDDMIYFQRHPGPGLREAAVFAAISGSCAYQSFERGIHADGARLMVLAEGQAGLGVHQVDEVADAKIRLKFGFLGLRQGIILVFDRKGVHTVEVGLVKAEQAQDGFGGVIGQIGFISVDDAGDDRCFCVACNALYRRHSLIPALIDAIFRVILAETTVFANEIR